MRSRFVVSVAAVLAVTVLVVATLSMAAGPKQDQ